MNEIKHDEFQLEQIWRLLKGDNTETVSPKQLKTICGVIQGVHSSGKKFTQFLAINTPDFCNQNISISSINF